MTARVDAVVWPMDGMLKRPTGFEALGALSTPGPLRTILAVIVAGRYSSSAARAYGPIAKRAGGRSPEPDGAGRCPLKRRTAAAARSRTRADCARSPGWCCSTRATASCCCTATSRTIRPTTGGSPRAAAWRATRRGRQAALRELAEETGITEVELGPVLWRRMCSFPFAGRRWDQDEWYYLARTTQTATGAAGLTELERRSVAGARWWTCRELAEAHETVYPTRLAELLRRLLDEGPPARPVILDTEIV